MVLSPRGVSTHSSGYIKRIAAAVGVFLLVHKGIPGGETFTILIPAALNLEGSRSSAEVEILWKLGKCGMMVHLLGKLLLFNLTQITI